MYTATETSFRGNGRLAQRTAVPHWAFLVSRFFFYFVSIDHMVCVTCLLVTVYSFHVRIHKRSRFLQRRPLFPFLLVYRFPLHKNKHPFPPPPKKKATKKNKLETKTIKNASRTCTT